MPNQSISEAECKRLAQVLEPKALPARSRSPQPPRTRRRDAAASRRGGPEHTPGLPKGRSRCGAGRRRPTKKKPNVTPRERPRLSESFRSESPPHAARAAHRTPRPHRTPARSTPSRPRPSRARGPARRTSRSGRASTPSSSGASRLPHAEERSWVLRRLATSRRPHLVPRPCTKNTFVLSSDVEHRRAP